MTNSVGDTTFAINDNAHMTVTNTTSSLAGYVAQSVPIGASLVVNNGSPVLVTGTVTVMEVVMETDTDPNGKTTKIVTTTTQTTNQNGSVSTTIHRTKQEILGGVEGEIVPFEDDLVYEVQTVGEEGEENYEKAGTYEIQLSGRAGNHKVSVTILSDAFRFLLNNAAINSTGDKVVTVQ